MKSGKDKKATHTALQRYTKGYQTAEGLLKRLLAAGVKESVFFFKLGPHGEGVGLFSPLNMPKAWSLRTLLTCNINRLSERGQAEAREAKLRMGTLSSPANLLNYCSHIPLPKHTFCTSEFAP